MVNSISEETGGETAPVEPIAGTAAPVEAAADAAPAEIEAAEIEAAEIEAAEIEGAGDRIIDAVTAGQQEALEAMKSAGEAVAMSVEVARRELVDFMTERLRRGLDTQQALLRCRSMKELRGIQFDYLRDTVQQYGGEATRLVRLGAALASRGLTRH